MSEIFPFPRVALASRNSTRLGTPLAIPAGEGREKREESRAKIRESKLQRADVPPSPL